MARDINLIRDLTVMKEQTLEVSVREPFCGSHTLHFSPERIERMVLDDVSAN
jgi:hypothetical protein